MAIDYRIVLEELKAEESRLKSELEAIQAMIPGAEVMARRIPVGPSLPLPFSPSPQRRESQTFTGMGTRQAIICLLVSKLKPIMPAEITRLLQAGGVDSRSSDFAGTVSSTLTQLRGEGLVERKEEGWVIAMRPDPMGNPPMNIESTNPIWVKIASAMR